MKLFWLKLVNYRQLTGENLIEFSTSDEKNITIIEGTTGAGKTTILNAMYWCLYGKEPTFENATAGVAPICNAAKLSEANVSTEVSVEMAFGDDIPKYVFKRTLKVWNTDQLKPAPDVALRREPAQGTNRLTTVYLNSNLVPVVTFDARSKESGGDDFTQASDYLVDHVLPPDLAFVFLFNGEALKEFFEQRNLQQALEDISQITDVKRAIEHLGNVHADLRREASRKNADTDKLSKEVDEYEKQIKEATKRKDKLEGEIADFERRIRDIDAKLKSLNVESISRLVDNRKDANQRADDLAKVLKDYNGQRDKLLVRLAPEVFLRNEVSFMQGRISELDQSGNLPPPIKTVFLNELLAKGTCICGRPIDEHGDDAAEARRHIENLLKEQSTEEAVSYKALEAKFVLPEIARSISTGLSELTSVGARSAETETQLRAAENRAKSINKELEQFESAGRTAEDVDQEVRSLQAARRDLEKDKEKAISDKGGEIHAIETLSFDKKKKDRELAEELKKKSKSDVFNERRAFAERALEQLNQIQNGMVSEVRDDIERSTDGHFKDLIWKTADIERKAGEKPVIDSQKLQAVKIEPNNEIKVMTKDGQNWIRSLSQGETQTLAYSFISALKEGARVDFPMVVDTPLGIIDEGPPRELFAELLPEFVKDTQLIFLMTSAEYTPNVRRVLSQRVGGTYRLVYETASEGTRVEKIG